jgi:hypothetical protein
MSAAILAISACGGDDDDDAGSDGGDANAEATEFCNSIVATDEALAAANSGAGSPDAIGLAVQDVIETAPDDIADAVQNYADEAQAALAAEGGGEESTTETTAPESGDPTGTESTDTTEAEAAGVEIDTQLIAHVQQEEEGGAPDIPPDSFFEAQVEVYDYVADNCGFNVVDVTAKNYEFDGIPETLEAGRTLIRFTNEGTEYHEMVALPIPADEERSFEELLALPEEEQPEIQPAMFIFAPPGLGAATTVELNAGRHGAVCFIPVGTTPEAMAGGEPEEEGAPHFTEGMQAEFEVE